MSKLIKKPIILPSGTKVEIKDGTITVAGSKGSVAKNFRNDLVEIRVQDNQIFVSPKKDGLSRRMERFVKKLAGTYWSIINSMVYGVNNGYNKVLQIVGLGWKAAQKGEGVELFVGYSHPVYFSPPKGISLKVEEPQKIVVSGVDKELVGQVAANIYKIRIPDNYKGKGIRYADKQLNLKEIKKGVKGR